MSLNIIITANTVKMKVNSKGKLVKTKHTEVFPVAQTPTAVTREILCASNPLEKYIEYVETLDAHWSQDHICFLREWVTEHGMSNLRFEAV